MEKKMKEHHLLALLIISFLLHFTIQAEGNSSRYDPPDNIALDCGSHDGSDTSGRSWIGDINSPNYSPIEKTKTSFISDADKTPTTQVVPYLSARVSTSEFTYSFPVTTGPKFIRLYFYPSNYKNFTSADAFFTVKWGDFTLLNNFNANSLVADSLKIEGFTREFCVLVETSQRLDLTFTPSTSQPNSYAFINGIEVVSMPEELYFKPVVDTNKSLDGFKYIGLNNVYPYSNIRALELIRRLNVGGGDVQSANDTGMYRTWEDDSDYVSSVNKGFVPANLTIALDYEKISKYTAPDVVYQTARSMGNKKTINYSYNLTWSFRVDSGFDYLLRLHFCEFEFEIVNEWDRTFKIYIDKQVAEDYASVIRWSGGNGNPIYQDYVVFMPDSNKKTSNLDIALHPNPEILTSYSDAFLNGIEIFKIGTLYGKNLAGPNPDPGPRPQVPSSPGDETTNGGLSGKAILGIAGGSAFGIATFVVLCFIIYKRKEKRRKSSPSECTSWWGTFSHATTKSTKSHASALPSDLCRHFSLMELKTATNNFDDIFKIGVGGFGKVYKGYIDGGSIPVAIKRLDPGSQQGLHEFMTEIEMLTQLRHLHLVSLIGYCNEQGEMILVYDYMARGTLCDHLYNTANSPLPWKQRLRICIGAAHGLHYLHTGAKYTIIHRDMKSTNILLDENWVAKVSDFGLSKVGSMTASKAYISTVVKGTFGYLDPEYYRRQQLTEKSDVYSFGVVLFEVLCARPAVNKNVEKKQVSLAPWAKSCCRNGTIDRIIDPHLTGQIAPECLKKFCEIALSCLDDEGIKRPSMNDIVWGLEFALQLQESEKQDDKDVVEKIQELGYKQESGEPYIKGLVERVGLSDEVFSTSVCKSSGMITSSLSVDEQSLRSNDPDKFSFGAVFSELMNAKGR